MDLMLHPFILSFGFLLFGIVAFLLGYYRGKRNSIKEQLYVLNLCDRYKTAMDEMVNRMTELEDKIQE